MQEVDHDPHWLELVGKCLAVEHSHKNSGGWYTLAWEAAPLDSKQPVRLIDQSSLARAYWIAVEDGVRIPSSRRGE